MPDSIKVYIPWDPELDEIGLWQNEDGDKVPISFPCAYGWHAECEQAIASFTIGTLEAVERGDMSLPSSIDEAHAFILHRNGDLEGASSTFGKKRSLLEVIREHEGDKSLSQSDFNREFAHYYAGLVAQQRNNK